MKEKTDQQLTADTKRKFVIGFDAGETEARSSEWKQAIENQARVSPFCFAVLGAALVVV